MKNEHSTKLTGIVYEGVNTDNSEKQTLNGFKNNEKKTSWFLYFSAIVGNLFVFCSASGGSWTSPVLEMLKSTNSSINPLETPITAMQESWIASLYPLGSVIGPLVTAKLADVLGRKKTLLIISIPMLINYLVLCFTTNLYVFYIGRLIMGICAGTVYTVTPMYLSEISEVHNRGTIMSIMSVAINSGVLYCFLLGPFFSIKVLTFLCAVPLFLFIIFFGLFIPESPIFLVFKNNNRKAVEALQTLRGVLDVEDDLKHITKLTISETKSRRIVDIIKDKGLKKSLLICIGLNFALHSSGINPITAFLEAILKASASDLPVYAITNVVGIMQVVGTIISVAVVENMGRRIFLCMSITGCFFSDISMVIYFYLKDSYLENCKWLPVACLIFYILAFNMGLVNLPLMMLGEIFPHSAKAMGISFGISMCFAFSSIFTTIFRMIMEAYGLAHCFLLLSVCMLLSLLFVYFVVPETKGKTEIEIQEMLNT